jgi:hypothetical protein
MTNEKLIIIVPDDHYHKKHNYTFLVYDFENGNLIHKSPYNPDLDCKELEGQGRPTFRPYGITYDDDYIYIASHKKIAKYDRKTFEYCGLVGISMYINTHRMLKSGDDFYVTHTSVNTIGVHGKTNKYFNVVSFEWVEAPEHPDAAESHDITHLNSITEHEGKIYFCLNNLSVRPSEFGYLNKATGEHTMIGSAGAGCHDLQIIDNKLYSLSTSTGHIIEIDLATRQTSQYKVVKKLKTFLRGMDALDGKIIFIGSNHYSHGIVEMNNCFVASFDISTKQTKRLFNITHADTVACMKLV